MCTNIEHNKWKLVFLALSFHNNEIFLTLDHCSLTLGNLILTFENLGPRVNDSWDSDPSENPAFGKKSLSNLKRVEQRSEGRVSAV